MRLHLIYIYAFLCIFAMSSKAYAQAIILNPDSLPTVAVDKVISYETLYVNGQFTHGLTQKISERHINLGNMYKTLLTFTSLRLAAKGQIKLHESISFTVPEVLERNPFRVAITPHHILTETAGFAVPALISDAPLERYISHMRTAGQMAHDDIVGWAVLIRFLEAKRHQPIEQIVEQEVLAPLGLTEKNLQFPDEKSPLLKLQGVTGSGKLITEMARLMIRNQTISGERFLPPEQYDLMMNTQSWRMHPLAPNHSYGGIFRWHQNQRWLELAPSAKPGPGLMAFPEAGLVFIKLTSLTENYRATVTDLAHNHFLPVTGDNRHKEAELLVPYERFSGHYVRADAPTAWLKDRLQTINDTEIYIREDQDGTLSLRRSATGQTFLYEPKAPFHYKGDGASTLTLSPYKSGGYLLLDGVLYRYASILGNSFFVISLFPFAVILLLSSGFYMKSRTSKAWRRMGQFGTVGTLLICTGLLCDYLWWPTVLFEWDMPILITVWRTLLNIGLMLILSLPMFALSFVRQNSMPEGPALMYVPLHLALISVASAALFLILIAWGIAAEFSAY